MTVEQATDWVSLARGCFETSVTYADSNWRKTWERNIALFQSRHPAGSKYNGPDFKQRSRFFRPKTRSLVRKNEAAAAAAFFSNRDCVTIEAENDGDPMQKASADLMSELLNYRLESTIPWYMTLLGAFQDSQIMGAVASYQYWMYAERNGAVVEDKPCIDLIPLENLHFSPAAGWTDPAKSSPWLIRRVPMYVDDVLARMDESGGPRQPWIRYSDQEIRAAMAEYDSTRVEREQKRQDPQTESVAPFTPYETVWCHENFMRVQGVEVVYWTLGTDKLLSDPAPLESVYATGERPIVIGYATFESHRVMPEALVGMSSEMQREINDIANQRRDNVSLVLNKRWIIRRGGQIDTDSLMRNVPGGAITADDPEADVRELSWPDVTASAYAEQDRLNVDFDELTGNFSTSSVATNRQLNETVGGMRMLGTGAQQLTEYLIRTFAETWVEPVLRQLVKLEQQYENDATVLTIAGRRAELADRHGVGQITDELLSQPLTVRVNVGLGATDPHTKLQRFTLAAQTYAGVMQALPDADPQAVRSEVFALAGYRSSDRFFGNEQASPSLQAQQQIQELQGEVQALGQKLQVAELQLHDKSVSERIDAFDAETKRMATVLPLLQADDHQQQEAANAALAEEPEEDPVQPMLQAIQQNQEGFATEHSGQMESVQEQVAAVVEAQKQAAADQAQQAQLLQQQLHGVAVALQHLISLVKADRERLPQRGGDGRIERVIDRIVMPAPEVVQ